MLPTIIKTSSKLSPQTTNIPILIMSFLSLQSIHSTKYCLTFSLHLILLLVFWTCVLKYFLSSSVSLFFSFFFLFFCFLFLNCVLPLGGGGMKINLSSGCSEMLWHKKLGSSFGCNGPLCSLKHVCRWKLFWNAFTNLNLFFEEKITKNPENFTLLGFYTIFLQNFI